jgi:hypothetical protein
VIDILKPMRTCEIENFVKKNYPGIKREVKCSFPCLSSDPDGLCVLHSQRIDKNSNEFYAVIQAKLKKKDFDFKFVLFPASISFEYQEFDGNSDFYNAIFICNANFKNAIFDSNAIFMDAEFCGLACFDRVIFNDGCSFSYSKFYSDVSFLNTDFTNYSIFESTSFKGQANFSFSEFKGQSIFADIEKPFNAIFQEISLSKNCDLEFINTPLENVIFKGTNLLPIKFHNVNWRIYHGRNIIFDEISYVKRHGIRGYILFCPGVERMYRYLKLNYEKEGDFKKQGIFIMAKWRCIGKVIIIEGSFLYILCIGL